MKKPLFGTICCTISIRIEQANPSWCFWGWNPNPGPTQCVWYVYLHLLNCPNDPRKNQDKHQESMKIVERIFLLQTTLGSMLRFRGYSFWLFLMYLHDPLWGNMEAILSECFFKWVVRPPLQELFSRAGSMKSFPEMKDFVIHPPGYLHIIGWAWDSTQIQPLSFMAHLARWENP